MAVLRALRILFVACLLVVSQRASAAANEYQVKAVFLYNFSRFVEWPSSAFATATAPLVVGVFGHDPFGLQLDEVVRGESVAGRPLIVRRVETLADAAVCHILFIHQSESAQLEKLLAAIDHNSVLTVSDVPGAMQRGVMIRLVTQDGRIHMRIDVEAARAAHLTLSSNLLRAAEIVAAEDAR